MDLRQKENRSEVQHLPLDDEGREAFSERGEGHWLPESHGIEAMKMQKKKHAQDATKLEADCHYQGK
jgi:hypothetical protein